MVIFLQFLSFCARLTDNLSVLSVFRCYDKYSDRRNAAAKAERRASA